MPIPHNTTIQQLSRQIALATTTSVSTTTTTTLSTTSSLSPTSQKFDDKVNQLIGIKKPKKFVRQKLSEEKIALYLETDQSDYVDIRILENDESDRK